MDKSYSDFFQQGTGNKPFPYQAEFQHRQITSFAQLEAPTGVGKTETVVCDWLYGVVFNISNTPSRLILTLPLRTLVEQTYSRVRAIVKRLNLEQKIGVHLLMGGAVDNEWDLDLSQKIILIGTQDQILSRQLNRGYCLSTAKYPIHFAALNNDCRIVIDETQLQGVSYLTAVKLQDLRNKIGCYGNTQLILCSATLDSQPLNELQIDAPIYSIGAADYQHPYLGQKLTKIKQLQKTQAIWSGKSDDNFIHSLRDEVISLHQDGLTLVVLNRVDSAQKLYESLANCGCQLRLIHSMFRPADRQALVEELTEFTGILISTQCIEAGIDLDAKVLITELCPWSSFVQRCGRAGRKNMTRDISIYWLDHKFLSNSHFCKPYKEKELKIAQASIETLEDASIKNLVAVEAPMQEIEGEHLRQERFKELFDTHPKNLEIDISCYIRTSLSNNVFIGWREFAGIPPQDWRLYSTEICSVPIYRARAFGQDGWRFDARKQTWSQIQLSKAVPGDLFLLPCSSGGYSVHLGWTGKKRNIPKPILVNSPGKKAVSGFSSFCSTSISLTQHSLDAAVEMNQLLCRLRAIIPQELETFLVEVAQWHDAGKAHPIFQSTLGGTETNILAKSSRRGKHSRPGFRHELASALMALAAGKSFLFAYLVCCHHGKVRIDITPGKWDKRSSDRWRSRGIKEGDLIYAANLGKPIESLESQYISFSVIPGTKTKPWLNWSDECKKLLKHKSMGEFRLAYLETLVRCADTIASSKYGTD